MKLLFVHGWSVTSKDIYGGAQGSQFGFRVIARPGFTLHPPRG